MAEGRQRPQIIAHRGASKEAPDNSRAAFDAALRHGVAGIEFDVQLTLDGVPVIYHDRTLSRVGGGRRRISDFSLKELRAFDWGSWFDSSFAGAPLMTLDGVLRRYGRRTSLFLEIKSRRQDRLSGRSDVLTAKVLSAVRNTLPKESLEGVFLLSFDPGVLVTAARKEPGWNYILNIESPDDWSRGNRPRGVRLHACCLPVARLTPAFAHRLHRDGLQVMTYSCNTPRQALRALRARADTILTDDPRWLGMYLAGKEGSRAPGL
jgi:glycerophosphoryl diester phosphodiesterase